MPARVSIYVLLCTLLEPHIQSIPVMSNTNSLTTTSNERTVYLLSRSSAGVYFAVISQGLIRVLMLGGIPHKMLTRLQREPSCLPHGISNTSAHWATFLPQEAGTTGVLYPGVARLLTDLSKIRAQVLNVI